MATSQSKYIGAGTTIVTILALLGWFNYSDHFETQWEGDKYCAGTYEDPCEWNYNITLTTTQYYYIYNKDAIDLVFLPDVKQVVHCKKDGRMRFERHKDREQHPCGLGWREFDWKTPLTSRYKYINKFYKGKKQEFKIVVFKHNPEDEIKFGGEITKDEFDPFFYGTWNVTKYCDWRVETQDVYGDVTYEYTCQTDYPVWNTTTKMAYCYERVWEPVNSTWNYNLIFNHKYDYGYPANKTAYWTYEQKIGTKNINICENWKGVYINGKLLDWNKAGFKCSRPEQRRIECDRCVDVGNCDGILDSGESGCIFILNQTIRKSCNGNTPNLKRIFKRFNVKT